MATVVPVLPTKGAKKFRDGCAKHWQLRPNPSEYALGVRKQTFCKQGPADARRSEIRDQIHRGVFAPDDKTTVSEWCDQWITAAEARGVRLGSLNNFRVHARHVKASSLGPRLMTAVRPEHVRTLIGELREKGLGASRVSDVVHSLRGMFNLWVEDGRTLPRGNPVARGTAPRPAKRHTDPLTVAQVHAWRDALPVDMRALMDVESYYGGRMGEVLGLREENIRFIGLDVSAPLGPQLVKLAEEPADRYAARKPTIRFEGQLGYTDLGGPGRQVPTKNERANRTLGLPQWLAAVIGERLIKWPPSKGWLFVNPRRTGNAPATNPMPYQHAIYRKWLTKAAHDAGITLPRGQNSHALRHHCVSVLRDKGFSDQAIGDWIGDTAQTVTATYGRPMPDTLDRIQTALDAEHTAPRKLRAV